MHKKWKSALVIPVLSAALLLGITAAPYAANLNDGKATTAAQSSTESPAQAAPTTTANTAKPAEPSKKQKSILDAEVLQSPFSFLKDAASSEEEDSEIAAKSSMVVLALKALAATLLSTIM